MNKYTKFDKNSKSLNTVSKFGKMLMLDRDNEQCQILKMPQSFTVTSPYSKITDFNTRTKIVCQKTDLSVFLDNCNIIFIGDCGVGKSSLINRFVSSVFNHCYTPTRDTDYKSSFFEILNIGYNVGIWELSVQETCSIFNKPYYKNVDGKKFQLICY